MKYDFYRRDLWEKRLDSIDDSVDRTFNLFRDVILTIEGLSAEKFVELIGNGP